VILLSVYCTKTAIDIFTFYRFIFFLHCLSCVCQLFIKDYDDDDDDDAVNFLIIYFWQRLADFNVLLLKELRWLSG